MAKVECPNCQTDFDVKPRPSSWTGRCRTELECPSCHFVFRWKPLPKGAQPDKPKVALRGSNAGPSVFIDDYDVTTEQAEAFATAWQSVWNRLPPTVTALLDSYWSPENGEPHVWLIDDRKEWGGGGWAATRDNGMSFYFLASLVVVAPSEIIDTMIAHELAHAVCLAVREENHVSQSREANVRIRRECIVWRLIESWGFDQNELDAQLEIQFHDDGDVVCRRETPLAVAPTETAAFKKRQEYEERLQGFELPENVCRFLRS